MRERDSNLSAQAFERKVHVLVSLAQDYDGEAYAPGKLMSAAWPLRATYSKRSGKRNVCHKLACEHVQLHLRNLTDKTCILCLTSPRSLYCSPHSTCEIVRCSDQLKYDCQLPASSRSIHHNQSVRKKSGFRAGVRFRPPEQHRPGPNGAWKSQVNAPGRRRMKITEFVIVDERFNWSMRATGRQMKCSRPRRR